jgi:hypothetical protein
LRAASSNFAVRETPDAAQDGGGARRVEMPGMDLLNRFAKHTHKLFASPAALVLPRRHRMLQVHTVELWAEGALMVCDENLPLQLDGLVRMNIPRNPAGTQAVIAHVRTLNCVFDGSRGGFLVELQFTDIPAPSVAAIKAFLSD